MALYLSKFESPLPKDTCAKFDWNWPCGSWEEGENVTRLQTDWQTDDKQALEKLTWAFSSDELKINASLKLLKNLILLFMLCVMFVYFKKKIKIKVTYCYHNLFHWNLPHSHSCSYWQGRDMFHCSDTVLIDSHQYLWTLKADVEINNKNNFTSVTVF